MTEATRIVTPEQLRAAAHAIILDGEEAAFNASRKAGSFLAQSLGQNYLAHFDELWELVEGLFPPSQKAEIRLLELFKEETNRLGVHDYDSLIDTAIKGPDAPAVRSSFRQIRGTVKQYPCRTARATDIFLRLPRESVQDLEEQLAGASGARIDNHTVYEIYQFSGITYVQFSGFEATFGRVVIEERW